VGRRLGIGPDELRLVSHAAELSEMGRMLLPEEIRNKPGRLEEGELEVVRGHTMGPSN
jgi:HD-GYP domain-containing protein (c-di-GMP phosphodiesterase class II)